MTLEAEQQTFRGVICLHCKASIPVPAIVDDRSGDGAESTERSLRHSQVFNLRCPCCHKEKPYRTREILNFEGTPGTIIAEKASPMRWYPQDGVARAAKA
jgi:hypothetical protein